MKEVLEKVIAELMEGILESTKPWKELKIASSGLNASGSLKIDAEIEQDALELRNSELDIVDIRDSMKLEHHSKE